MSTKAPPPAYSDEEYESAPIVTNSPLVMLTITDRPTRYSGFGWEEWLKIWEGTHLLSARSGMIHRIFDDVDRSDYGKALQYCLRMANGHYEKVRCVGGYKHDVLAAMAFGSILRLFAQIQHNQFPPYLYDIVTFRSLMWFLDPKVWGHGNIVHVGQESKKTSVRKFLQTFAGMHWGAVQFTDLDEGMKKRAWDMLQANRARLIAVLYGTGYLDIVDHYELDEACVRVLERAVLRDPVPKPIDAPDRDMSRVSYPSDFQDAITRGQHGRQGLAVAVLSKNCLRLGLRFDLKDGIAPAAAA